MGRRWLSASGSWWLCAAALFMPLSLTVASAQRPAGAAWLLRSLDRPADSREARADVLDTPVLPGSVIKAVTLVAALEAQVIDPDTARMCRRTFVDGGVRYSCSHPDLKRPLTAVEALAHSCNDFFVSLAPRLSRAAVNGVRQRIGLPPIAADDNLAASLVGLDGPRVTPRALLEAMARLIGADRRQAAPVAEPARRVLREGLRAAAAYGSASELASRRIPALAKTGTAARPGGGVLGLLVAFVPPEAPRQALVVVTPGAAGRDAVSIAADLLDAGNQTVRVGVSTAGGGSRTEPMALEDYVARVLAGEGQPAAAAAAQQALAIAARTFVLANRGRHRDEGFDVCDTTHCQVLRPATALTRRSAAATAGQVLLDGGRPASIYYSAWCGGHSELPSAVWPAAVDHPFDHARPDDACAGQPAWTSEVAAADLEAALRAAGSKGTQLRGLTVLRRSRSGRAVTLRAEGFAPSDVSAEAFRMALGRSAGWQLLKSAMFEMQRTSRGYRFTGRGSGHGVGMCIIGAGVRAARGATAGQILGFYYPGLHASRYQAEVAGGDLELALPAAEERERSLVAGLVRQARDEMASRARVRPPPSIRVTVHPNVASFGRATGLPWWTAGATDRTSIALLPVTVLRQRGQLERTIRHEVAHVLVDAALAGRPMWVREGAAAYFAHPSAARATPAAVACPGDAELKQPLDAAAQRDAYARAEACFARAIAAGTAWRDVR